MNETINKPVLRLLILITEWERVPKLKEIFEGSLLHFCYLTKAEGTASSETLDMLGLGATDKALVLCLAPQIITQTLLQKANNRLLLAKKGTGIAFTVPLTGIVANIVKILKDEVKEGLIDQINKIESEVEKMKNETSMTLILSIINQGYSEGLMDAARSAGAKGGTVINARRLEFGEQTNFLGLSMPAEKEVVYIIAEREHKASIMQAINHECGLESEAGGVTISLPVESVVGI